MLEANGQSLDLDRKIGEFAGNAFTVVKAYWHRRRGIIWLHKKALDFRYLSFNLFRELAKFY